MNLREDGKTKNQTTKTLSVKDLCLIGIMVAMIEVCKVAMSFLPNIELTSLWLILFTLFFGRKVWFTVPVFILLEGCLYGFSLWWVMYLYAWPLLVFLTRIFRKQENVWFWSILSGAFGLFFGALCSLPYGVMGILDGGLRGGIYAAFTWWVAGIPWDIVHGISNFVLMLVLYFPVFGLLKKVKEASVF